MKVHKFTNRLAQETSPYLLQHAHNPVDWYPWGDEAFQKASSEDKPILVSIGYSTCHWCHVMERESFEDEEIAAFMNEHFINIKVDREERPDVDQIYMDTCQIMTGSGGWPLNCFLTPEAKPFLAGTYYPPRPAHGRASWIQVLHNIHHAFKDKRKEVEAQANRITSYLEDMDSRFLDAEPIAIHEDLPQGATKAQNLFYTIREQFDRVEGGFGSAPKFPGTLSLQFLLRYAHVTGNPEAIEHVHLSLEKMIRGGIYDQLGGGFARYATDRAWLVPHFEKMLYDNALLVRILAEAYQVSGNPLYAETIRETLVYIEREMVHPEGGFYSAQDADSEGVEGKFFVWDKSETESLLEGEKYAEEFMRFYNITDEGNWEHNNILWRPIPIRTFAEKNQLPEKELKSEFDKYRKILFTTRHKRIYPGLDDKILLSWNALMITAYTKAYHALGDEHYKKVASDQLNFIRKNFRIKEDAPACWHSFKDGQGKQYAFLDDYAFLIQALLSAYTLEWDVTYLHEAKAYAQYLDEEFWSEEKGIYFFTQSSSHDLIVRKSDLYDNATPSGNSTMLLNLQLMQLYFGETSSEEKVSKMLKSMEPAVMKYTSSFSNWAIALLNDYFPPAEIAIIGSEFSKKAGKLIGRFLPETAILASDQPNEEFPLLKGREVVGGTLLYVCRNYMCQLPVETVEEAYTLTLSELRKNQ